MQGGTLSPAYFPDHSMDQPAQPTQPRSVRPRVSGKPALDPDALPPSAARRAQLLFMLIILPVVAVSLPAIFVTLIFGQHPKPKPGKVDVDALKTALQRSATLELPTPATLTGEPVRLTCRPDRLAARAERVVKQAEAFGGAANEWTSSDAGEKHFFVELPAGRAEAFRQSLAGNSTVTTPTLPPAATSTVKDQVEVFIRASNDE